MRHPEGDTVRTGTDWLGLRLGIGLMQGILAWCLLELLPDAAHRFEPKAEAASWPAHHPMAFATLSLLTAFVPVIALAEAGRMRVRRLGLYLAAMTAVLTALAIYDIWREPMQGMWNGAMPRYWPSATLIFCGGMGCFMLNQLLEHRERGHGLFAAYAIHFEDSWMRGVQFVMALVFSGLVWGVVELGSALFGLIHLDWFGRMIAHNWFRCPVLAMSFAASVHITDVRPALITGMRNLGLILLSWLLPLTVVLGIGFVLGLGVSGLAPLWATRRAGSILLSAVAVLLVLVNAAYRDGDADALPPAPIRWAGRAAGPLMLILAGLAAYAIALRVGQYGWTPDRLSGAIVGFMALVYGGGYTWASLRGGQWLCGMERVNVSAAIATVAIVLGLLTPLLDPARVSVHSQVARLMAGRLAPEKFDYQFLRWQAGRYGTDALAELASGGNAEVARRARLAQAETQRIYTGVATPDPALTEPALSHATVYPRGARLPASLNAMKWDDGVPYDAECLKNGSPCDIIIWQQQGRGSPLLVVVSDTRASQLVGGYGTAPVFGQDSHGQWRLVGQLHRAGCSGVLDALRAGKAVSAPKPEPDLMANGLRLSFTPDVDDACPNPPKPKPAPAATGEAQAPAQMGPAFGHPGGR